MKIYLFKRILQVIPVLLIISFIVFFLVHIAGDPVSLMLSEDATAEDIANLKEALGLDRPAVVQFGHYIWSMLQGDFGQSFRYDQPAIQLVMERLPATLELAGAAMLIAILVSIPLGIWSAVKRNTFIDVFITGASVLGKAMPNFWLGIMLILLLAVQFQFFPPSGREGWLSLVLPALTLGTSVLGEMTRMIRSSMLEIMHHEYIRTARSKGLGESIVIFKHAFRNTLIPVVTITFLQASSLVSGALITETVFAWPGLGQLLITAVYTKDMAIVQASVFVIAIMVILINLVADILYRLLDPRIRYD